MNLDHFLASMDTRCPSGYDLATQHPHLCPDCPVDEWAVFLDAVRRSVRDGRVHLSDLRPKLRGRIAPKHIGLMVRRARAEGLLVEVAHERSDDVQGRNAGRMEPLYAWRGDAA